MLEMHLAGHQLGDRQDAAFLHLSPSRRERQHHTCRIIIGSVLVVLSTFFVLFLQWHSDAARVVAPKLSPSLEGDTSGETHVSIPSPAPPARDLKILLHPEEHLYREPRVTYLFWNVTSGDLAPDGVVKRTLLINGHFPGPTIEARSGDVLEIEVSNFLDVGISLHWHGLYMRNANEMDGPVGITQCAISPGKAFTYRVPVDSQAGTFWYHAHSEVLRGDGLYGGLVVHDPSSQEQVTYQYDKELLFLVGDWYHRPAQEVLDAFMSPLATGNEPNPSSLIINGLGHFQCSRALPAAPVNCSEIEEPWIQLNKTERYRIRLANVGSLTGFSFTIPDSEMDVIQVDGGHSVVSHTANSVGVLFPAERVDFVVGWSEQTRNLDSQIVIDLDHEYFVDQNFALLPTQDFRISAETFTEREDDALVSENETTLARFDLQKAKGPTLDQPLPDARESILLYSSIQILSHENYRPMGFINRTSWRPLDLPLLALDHEEWNKKQLVSWIGSEPGWVDIVINNLDGAPHPFHLHGFDFYVIASHQGVTSWDYYNPYDPSKPPRGGPFNSIDPLRKDTVLVPAFGYVVLRFFADNEGIWVLHCHILWHQGSGMSMALQVLGDEHNGFSTASLGQSAKEFCLAQTHQDDHQ